MPVKQKVTLYIPDDLHRQFKVRSAVDGETMSSIAQRAIEFYLDHADVVESSSEDVGKQLGQTHRIHTCPKCTASVALRDGSLSLIQAHSKQCYEGVMDLERMVELNADSRSPDEEELVSC